MNQKSVLLGYKKMSCENITSPVRDSNRLNFSVTLRYELKLTKISHFSQELLQTHTQNLTDIFQMFLKHFTGMDVSLFLTLAYCHKAN